MPELPEVETIKQNLIELQGKKIINFTNRFNLQLRTKLDPFLSKYLKNQTISHLERIGKYLIIKLTNNAALLIHLGMSGNLYLKKIEPNHNNINYFDNNKHLHWIIQTPTKLLCYFDIRKFGLLKYFDNYQNLQVYFKENQITLDALSPKLTADYFFKLCSQAKSISIKQFLLNQKKIAGLGNIYINEALFYSNIDPFRIPSSLSKIEANTLIKNTKAILKKAIEKGGSSIKDFKQNEDTSGYFQYHFKIYGKANQKCPKCKTNIIKKEMHRGRSTFFCNHCQK